VSWYNKSKVLLAKTIPVNPPTVNKNRNPKIQTCTLLGEVTLPLKVTNHLKTLIPVGTAIIIVAVVK
jgi:hypothetical protein